MIMVYNQMSIKPKKKHIGTLIDTKKHRKLVSICAIKDIKICHILRKAIDIFIKENEGVIT